MGKLSDEAKHMLAWKAGLTFTAPWPPALRELRNLGLVTDGDILSSSLTDAGRAALKAEDR